MVAIQPSQFLRWQPKFFNHLKKGHALMLEKNLSMKAFPKHVTTPILWGMKKFICHPKLTKKFYALESPKNVNP
jgi:hypothetical protein